MEKTTLSFSDLETAPLRSSSDQPSSSPCRISSPTSSPPGVVMEKYDVFLSFRGEDTRKTFMGHLRDEFSQKKIKAFVDDDQLETGQSISPQLLQAIENSSCSVVILSPNYASSTWCLEELVKILDCKRTKSQIVIPIFYHVEPSDVRNQTGSFGEAIAKHEMRFTDDLDRVSNWRVALKQLADLAGLDLKNYRDEANFVREIVEEVSSKLPSTMTVQNGIRDNCCIAVRTLAFIPVFYLVFALLFGLFFFKILVPIFKHFIIGDVMKGW